MVAIATPTVTVFNQGQVVSGAKIYTYLTGTTTLVDTYSNAGLTVKNANPITADANGQASIYIPTNNNIRLDFYTSDGVFIRTVDPVYPAATATGGTSGVEAVIPSAATTDLGSAGVNIISVTGTTNITSFGSSASVANPIFTVRFSGTLTIQQGANIVTPNGSNITTANGSAIIALYRGSGVWQILFVQSASGASYLQVSNNLSDVASASSALSNLGGAPLASPGLTGTPTAPTAPGGTNTNQIATTGFVQTALSGVSIGARVTFNGTGTVAILNSANVSSITDNGVGDYTVNITSALPSGNFTPAGMAQEVSSNPAIVSISSAAGPTTTSLRINVQDDVSTNVDSPRIGIIMVGG